MKTNQRSMQDRRTGKDRRKRWRFTQLFSRHQSKRDPQDRRVETERRSGWVRFTKWSSVYLPKLKISKFLKPLQ